jgi:hypothetical protein
LGFFADDRQRSTEVALSANVAEVLETASDDLSVRAELAEKLSVPRAAEVATESMKRVLAMISSELTPWAEDQAALAEQTSGAAFGVAALLTN